MTTIPSEVGRSSSDGEVEDRDCTDQPVSLAEVQAGDSATNVSDFGTVPTHIQPYWYSTEHDTDNLKRSCANQFVKCGKSVKVLFAMAIGTKGLSFNALEMLDDPAFASKKSKSYPNMEILRDEVSRRAHFIKSETGLWAKDKTGTPVDPLIKKYRRGGPRPKQWVRADVDAFFAEFSLILDERDIAFLNFEVQRQRSSSLLAVETQLNAANDRNETYWERKGWQNLGFRCRFIETITCESMVEHFIERDSTAKSRTEVDGSNTDSATKSSWQHLADRFNNVDYNPKSQVLEAEWGEVYATSHDLSWTELKKYGCEIIKDDREMRMKWITIF